MNRISAGGSTAIRRPVIGYHRQSPIQGDPDAQTPRLRRRNARGPRSGALTAYPSNGINSTYPRSRSRVRPRAGPDTVPGAAKISSAVRGRRCELLIQFRGI